MCRVSVPCLWACVLVQVAALEAEVESVKVKAAAEAAESMEHEFSVEEVRRVARAVASVPPPLPSPSKPLHSRELSELCCVISQSSGVL